MVITIMFIFLYILKPTIFLHLFKILFQVSAMSLPDNNNASFPNFSSYFYFKCFAYYEKICCLVFASGKSNITDVSVLEISAGSKSDFLFVAQINKTSF